MAKPWYYWISNQGIEEAFGNAISYMMSLDRTLNPNSYTRNYNIGGSTNQNVANTEAILDAVYPDATKKGADLGNRVKPYVDQIYNAGLDVLSDPLFQALTGQTRNTYVPVDSSSTSVSSGTSANPDAPDKSSPLDSYLTYLNMMKEMNEANNAFNVEQAQKQMDFQREQNKIFMDFNALEAQKSRDWQTEMSNTAYQRQVADMQAAGLNPVLAASGGNGASIGSGTAASAAGAASGSKATADNLYGSAILSMMNSALDIAEKNASAAITANAVAARNISSDSKLNLKGILNGVKDILGIFKLAKGLFV